MQQPTKKTKKEKRHNSIEPAFSVAGLTASGKYLSWKIMLPVWAVLVGLIIFGYHYNWEPRMVGGGVLLLAIFSNAFAWLVATAGLVPLVGPFLVKILALPIIWLLNSIGSVISYVAIRRGYSRDVLTYRGLTIALVVGIVIGYVLGKFI